MHPSAGLPNTSGTDDLKLAMLFTGKSVANKICIETAELDGIAGQSISAGLTHASLDCSGGSRICGV